MRYKLELQENPTVKDIENYLTGAVQKRLWKIIKEDKVFMIDDKVKQKFGDAPLRSCLLKFCKLNILKKIEGKVGYYEISGNVKFD